MSDSTSMNTDQFCLAICLAILSLRPRAEHEEGDWDDATECVRLGRQYDVDDDIREENRRVLEDWEAKQRAKQEPNQ